MAKDDLPTPEELGDMLKRGEITKEEAIEVMSERARREAFAGLYGPLPQPSAEPGGEAPPRRRSGPWVLAAVIILVVLLAILLG